MGGVMRKSTILQLKGVEKFNTKQASKSNMFEFYHHGLCQQGRQALQIESTQSKKIRRAKLVDAAAVILWGLGLVGLMWLGAAAGF